MERNTIQKNLVLDAVFSLRNHPTAHEIYEYISRKNPTISKGTVYRNLNTLWERGKINRVQLPNTGDIYDFNAQPHYHVICSNCGRLFDVPLQYDGSLIEKVPPCGFEIHNYQLIFSGKCPNCVLKQQ